MLGKQIMITDKSLLRFKNNGKFDDPFFKTSSAQTFFKWWLGDWGLVFMGGAVLYSFLWPFSWSLSMSLPSMQTDFNVSHYLPWQSIIFPRQTSSANKVLVKKSSFAPLEYINSWRRWAQLNAHDFPHKWIMFLEGAYRQIHTLMRKKWEVPTLYDGKKLKRLVGPFTLSFLCRFLSSDGKWIRQLHDCKNFLTLRRLSMGHVLPPLLAAWAFGVLMYLADFR